MTFRQHWRSGWSTLMVLGLSAFCGQALQATPLPSDKVEQLLREAQEFETGKPPRWGSAADVYRTILTRNPSLAEVREHYQVCLRHIHQARRLRDETFQRDLVSRNLDGKGSALEIYAEVLDQVQQKYLDHDRASPALLFLYGLQELTFALEDPEFIQKYLTNQPAENIRAFALSLEEARGRTIHTREEARDAAQAVALSGRRLLELPPPVVVLELACGACGALDEYSVCLTPTQYKEIQAQLRGEVVGVGIEVGLNEQNQPIVSQVYPEGPANERLAKGDRLLKIDGKSVEHLTPPAAFARLRGENGTVVSVEVQSPGDASPRTVKLERRAVTIRTVESARLIDMDVGYIKLTGFQKSTVTELKEAILDLQAKGMRVLVLDLRDNGGGAFFVAVDVAEMFLTEGLIATGESRLPDLNKKLKEGFRSNNPNAFNAVNLPMLVLVNGDTASAAEVLAAALRENHRARLIGQTTFGKATMQCYVPIRSLPTGLRITVARFYSPLGQSYHGRGLTPDISMDFDPMTAEVQMTEVLGYARELVRTPVPPMPPQ